MSRGSNMSILLLIIITFSNTFSTEHIITLYIPSCTPEDTSPSANALEPTGWLEALSRSKSCCRFHSPGCSIHPPLLSESKCDPGDETVEFDFFRHSGDSCQQGTTIPDDRWEFRENWDWKAYVQCQGPREQLQGCFVKGKLG